MTALPVGESDPHGASDLLLEEVRDRRALKRFLEFPRRLYLDDPNWVPPLTLERMLHLDPRKNPFFHHADVAYWLARRGGLVAGRISAQVNRIHLDQHRDATGHFGFLEAEDDPQVFTLLLHTAESWLKARGMKRVVGPFSLSINDESGLLVDGFDSPPVLMMNHARRYYAPRLEEQGYRKAKDLIAYHYDLNQEPPASVRRLLAKVERETPFVVRGLDMSRLESEIRTVVAIFNDAWSDNWGFLPLSDAEVGYLAQNLKPLLHADSVAIAEVEGEAAAMVVTLPNLNEAIADLDGRLLPFGWLKLLWRLKLKGTRSGRMPLMGVRRRYHGTPLGAALGFAVIDHVRRHHAARGTRWGELSWILEENLPTRRLIETMGGRAYKTYRLFEKALT